MNLSRLLRIIIPLILLAQSHAEQPLDLDILQEHRSNTLEKVKTATIKKLEKLQKDFLAKGRLSSAQKVADAAKQFNNIEQVITLTEDGPVGLRPILKEARDQKRRINTIYQKELEKLLIEFGKKGDLKNATLLRKLINQTRNDLGRGEPLGEVKVTSDAPVSVKEMREGRGRLSGGFSAAFDTFKPALAESEFLRVPWQATIKHRCEATRSGNIYLLVIDPQVEDLPEFAEKITPLATGAYLDGFTFYRVYLEARQSIEFKGYEATIIAKKITK